MMMDNAAEILNSLGEASVQFGLRMLIQSSVLIAAMLGLDMILRKRARAGVRYCLWMLVLVKLLLPTTLSVPTGPGYWIGMGRPEVVSIALPEPSLPTEISRVDQPGGVPEPMPFMGAAQAPGDYPLESASTPPPPPITLAEISAPTQNQTERLPLSWQAVVLLVWCAVALAMFLLLIQRYLFVTRLVAQSTLANASMAETLESCRQKIGVKILIGLRLSPDVSSPAVCGIFRPVILVPESLPAQLDERHFRAILLHELGHVKRKDLWVNFGQTLLQIFYFYNPLLWFANARIRLVREQAVDEMALATMGEESEGYTETLVQVARLSLRHPAPTTRLVGVVESPKALAVRVKHILSRPAPKTTKIGVLGSIAVILAGAMLLPMMRAQGTGEEKKSGIYEKASASKNLKSEPPKKKLKYSAVRTLHFPKNRSLGKVEFRRAELENYQDFMYSRPWAELGDAKGTVLIPAKIDVLLKSDSEVAQDPTLLDCLKPNDLDALTVDFINRKTDLKHIGRLTGLQQLRMFRARVSDAELAHLRSLKSLWALTIERFPTTDAGLEHVAGLTSLEELAVIHSKIKGPGLKHLAPLSSLHSLLLYGNEIDDEGLSHLPELKNLRRINLVHCPITDKGLSFLANFTWLEDLDLMDTKVTDAGMAHLVGMRDLKELRIVNTKVGNAGMKELRKIASLQKLRMTGTNVRDKGLAHLEGHPNLWVITVSGIGEAGFKSLGRIPGLTSIDVKNAKPTERGLDALKALPLKYLRVNGKKLINNGVETASREGTVEKGAVNENKRVPASSQSSTEPPHAATPWGVVVDSEKNPVAGAEVALYRQTAIAPVAAGSGTVEKVKTDSQGRFRLKKPAIFRPLDSYMPGTESLTLLATHPDFAIGWAQIERGMGAASHTIILTEPQSIEVRVTNVAGDPIKGARVSPYAIEKGTAENPIASEHLHLPSGGIPLSAITNAEGKATVTNLPKSKIGLNASKPGYAIGLSFPNQNHVRLTKSATLHGAVKTPKGEPIKGAIVELRADWMFMYFIAMTDAEGRYRLEDLPAKGWDMTPWGKSDEPGSGKYRVKCYNPTGATNKEMLQLDAGADTTKDFALERGCVLAGRVVDITTGKAVPSAQMVRRIDIPGAPRSDNLDIVSDEKGRFRVVVPLGSQVRLRVVDSRKGDYIIDGKWENSARSRGEIFDQIVTKEMTDLEIKVKIWAVRPLEGRVVDANGKGVKATVHLHPDIPQAETDAEGRFTIKTAPTDRDYDLFAITDDRKLANLISLKAGATEATIRLEPTRAYEGLAQTSDARSTPDLKFTLDMRLNDSTLYRVKVNLTTDSEGKFKAASLCPQATYYAWWRSDDKQNRNYGSEHAVIDLSELKPNEPIRLEPKAYLNALMGRVVDDEGKPIEGARIGVERSNLASPDFQRNRPEIRSGADGDFTIARLAAGKIALRVSAEGYSSRSVTAPTDSVDLKVALAKISSTGIPYAITVRDKTGKPVEIATITCWKLSLKRSTSTTRTLTIKTDAAGRATFNRQPNKMKLSNIVVFQCDAEGYDLAYKEAPVDEAADVNFTLEKISDCWTGVLKDEKGQPVSGAKVYMSGFTKDADQKGRYAPASIGQWKKVEFKSDSQGAFRLPRVGRKNWVNIDIQVPGYALLREYFDPRKDKSPKTFTLLEGAEIIGKVARADGKPITESLTVYADAVSKFSNSNITLAKVDADGSFRIKGLNPGEYTIKAIHNDSTAASKLLCPDPPTVTTAKGKPGRATVTLDLGTLVEGKAVSASSKKLDLTNGLIEAKKNKAHNQSVFIEKDGAWKLYLSPGDYLLRYVVLGVGKQASAPETKITVKKGEPLTGIVIEAK